MFRTFSTAHQRASEAHQRQTELEGNYSWFSQIAVRALKLYPRVLQKPALTISNSECAVAAGAIYTSLENCLGEDHISRSNIAISRHEIYQPRQKAHKNSQPEFDILEGRDYIHDCVELLLKIVSGPKPKFVGHEQSIFWLFSRTKWSRRQAWRRLGIFIAPSHIPMKS